MESNGMGGGMSASVGPGMLALETHLHQQANPAKSQNSRTLHNPEMVSYSHQETDHHQQQSSMKHEGYPYSSKAKSQLTLSDEDEPLIAADDSGGDPKKKSSPWQRMKWTDTMVRLLITAVFYIGDEGGPDGADPSGKKKVTGGLLQKKGKWKLVSRAMMEKGFYVSPQQCEDKFNDLNKRHKRINDILGKGTACKVVENKNMLETMDLSPKLKHEVRKLLSSKHLFFREMCAYHNSCSHGTGVVTATHAHPSPETAGEPSHHQLQQQLLPQSAQQQRCFHSQGNVQVPNNFRRPETGGMKMVRVESGEEDDNEDEDSDDSEDDSEEDDEEIMDGRSRYQSGHGHDDDENDNTKPSRKRPRTAFSSQPQSQAQSMQQISSEVMNVVQDGSKSAWEKQQWMKLRLIQLEEQQVNCQVEACELEKQRLKWVKYSSEKERVMERAKLENERRQLENERVVLLIRQKEFELFNLQHHQPTELCQ